MENEKNNYQLSTVNFQLRVPKLRFPEFKDSGEWEEKKLGEIGKFVGGGTPSKSNDKYWVGNIPWISSSDVYEDNIHNISITRFINETAVNSSATNIIPKGSILVVSRVGVGKLAINKQELCTSQDFTNFLPNENVFNFFIGYYFLSNKNILQSLVQGTSIKGFTKNDLENLTLPFPTKGEQQKITSCLSSLDELLEARKQKLELLKQHKKGLMQNLFPSENDELLIMNDELKKENSQFTTHHSPLIPRLRFPEFKDSGEWGYLNGNKLFEPISNKNHNSDLPVLAITQEHGAIPRDLIDYTVIVSKKSVKNYKVVDVGDFIISLRTFQGGIEYSEYKGICSPAYIILRKKIEHLNNTFFKYFFKTRLYIRQLNKNLEGIRDGKMVSYKQFSEILLPFPSFKEQQKIAECLSSIDELITAEAEKIEQLEKHKKGLMQGLFPIMNDEL